MNVYREIADALHGRARGHVVAFAAGCAERLAPTFRAYAPPHSVRRFDAGLALLWSAAVHDAAPPAASRLGAELEGLPEAAWADEDYPRFAAWQALSTLIAAAEAVDADDLDTLAETASDLALEVAGNLDFMAEEPPRRPGRLAAAEIDAQQRVLRLLDASDVPWPEVVAEVRRLSEERAGELAAVLPAVARRHGWNST